MGEIDETPVYVIYGTAYENGGRPLHEIVFSIRVCSLEN